MATGRGGHADRRGRVPLVLSAASARTRRRCLVRRPSSSRPPIRAGRSSASSTSARYSRELRRPRPRHEQPHRAVGARCERDHRRHEAVRPAPAAQPHTQRERRRSRAQRARPSRCGRPRRTRAFRRADRRSRPVLVRDADRIVLRLFGEHGVVGSCLRRATRRIRSLLRGRRRPCSRRVRGGRPAASPARRAQSPASSWSFTARAGVAWRRAAGRRRRPASPASDRRRHAGR